jgi:hypothetical protein
MANQINLTLQQIDKLNEITTHGSANFAAGYEYISEIIKGNPNVDSYTKFFFGGARQVNGNFSTDANIYIRGVTEAGLAWDGRLESDPEARRAQIQATSDDIARNIIDQINRDKGIPQLDDIIQNDASLAVSAHGQSVGGWAGVGGTITIGPAGQGTSANGKAVTIDPDIVPMGATTPFSSTFAPTVAHEFAHVSQK